MLGATVMLEKANSFLLVGIMATTLVSYFSTRWIAREKQSAIRGAIGGAITVTCSVIIGMLIFYFSYGHYLELTELIIMTLASLAFIPVGMTGGAMAYGIRRKR